MATYRNGNQQVAFRNGIAQVGYHNGEVVIGGETPHILTAEFSESTVPIPIRSWGYSATSMPPLGDMQPRTTGVGADRGIGSLYNFIIGPDGAGETLILILDNAAVNDNSSFTRFHLRNANGTLIRTFERTEMTFTAGTPSNWTLAGIRWINATVTYLVDFE